VGKAWDFQVKVVLEIGLAENIDLIGDSVERACARGKEAMLDAEHFFDGFKANPKYATECVKAALDAGARWVILCDTNGGAMPEDVERVCGGICDQFGGERIGIHTHNDTEQAVANSLAAVRAGARQVQGTLNGLGERCGNANLVSLIPTLMLKPPYSDHYTIGVSQPALQHLTQTSRLLDELLNRAPNRHAAYVGASAFAHKGGLHVSAVAKDPRTYEHVPPGSVGNRRLILISDQAGRANVLSRLDELGIKVDARSPQIEKLLDEVKAREFQGYAYDGADASFELLARRALGQVPDYFAVESFRVLVERRLNARGQLVTVSEATVKVNVDGADWYSVGAGTGPVHALDQALRKDLGKYSAYLEELRLVDYKVRILTGGTEAVTRVMIESADRAGNRWFTVGVSPNIVDASFVALMDSITWKLYRDGAPAGVTNKSAPKAKSKTNSKPKPKARAKSKSKPKVSPKLSKVKLSKPGRR
jgi:2-isopropylmalate synthase